jgi:hypothetical protein
MRTLPHRAAIFYYPAAALELDDHGDPANEKHAERRAATWRYQYCTGELPPGESDLEPGECALY